MTYRCWVCLRTDKAAMECEDYHTFGASSPGLVCRTYVSDEIQPESRTWWQQLLRFLLKNGD